jgi:uncharacterized delta-60 repeat protein
MRRRFESFLVFMLLMVTGGGVQTQAGSEVANVTYPGQLDLEFNPMAGGSLQAVTVDQKGRILAGGDWIRMGEEQMPTVVRYFPDGQIDSGFSTGTGPNGAVQAIAVDADGKILIGGNFRRINGVNQAGLGRLDENGQLDSTFRPELEWVSSFLSGVKSILISPDGKIIAGGAFHHATRAGFNFVRLLPDGTVDPEFTSTGFGGNNEIWRMAGVYSLAFHREAVVAAGYFTSYNGKPVRSLARIKADGELDETFAGQLPAGFWAVLVVTQADGKIVVAGEQQDQFRLARLDENGFLEVDFAPELSYPARSLLLQPDEKILVGGIFQEAEGFPRSSLVRFLSDGRIDTGFTPGRILQWMYSGRILGLELKEDGNVLIAGDFTDYNGVPRPGLAQVRGGDPEPRPPVIVLQPQSQEFEAGKPIRLQADANSFEPMEFQWFRNGIRVENAVGPTLEIRNILPEHEGEYSARMINSLGQSSTHPASIDVLLPLPKPGMVDPYFHPGTGTDGPIVSIAVDPDGRVLIGGVFEMVDGRRRSKLARLQPSGELDWEWEPEVDSGADVIFVGVQPEGKIILQYGTIYPEHFAFAPGRIIRLHPDGRKDSSFQIPGETLWLLDVGSDGQILANSQENLVLLEPDGRLDENFRPGSEATHRPLARLGPDGEVFLPAWVSASSNFGGMIVLAADGEWEQFIELEPGVYAKSFVRQKLGSFLFGNPSGVVRFDPAGTLDPTFKKPKLISAGTWPETLPMGLGGRPPLISWTEISSLAALPDGSILAAGWFNNVNGIPRGNIVRLRGDEGISSETDRLLFHPRWDANGFSARIFADEGRHYSLEFRPQLHSGEWSVLDEVAGADTMLILRHAQPPGNKGIYRVRIE